MTEQLMRDAGVARSGTPEDPAARDHYWWHQRDNFAPLLGNFVGAARGQEPKAACLEAVREFCARVEPPELEVKGRTGAATKSITQWLIQMVFTRPPAPRRPPPGLPEPDPQAEATARAEAAARADAAMAALLAEEEAEVAGRKAEDAAAASKKARRKAKKKAAGSRRPGVAAEERWSAASAADDEAEEGVDGTLAASATQIADIWKLEKDFLFFRKFC